MSEHAAWKSALLASGLPLQHETARLLTSRGFTVDSDFEHGRPEHGDGGNASVNLRASIPLAPDDPTRAAGSLDLVVECRQPPPDVAWLFLPDPNPSGPDAPRHSPVIRAVDTFSLSSIDPRAMVAFDAAQTVCCKGAEIDRSAGHVADSEPRHALTQLQYALPRLLIDSVLRHFHNRSGEPGSRPFLFCPILVTTAPLLVARDDLETDQVQRAAELAELGTETPQVTAICHFGPDFQIHCRRQFKAFEALERNEDLLMIETKRAAVCPNVNDLPLATIESLMAADTDRLQPLFTRFLICTRTHLPGLVEAICRTALAAIESRNELQ